MNAAKTNAQRQQEWRDRQAKRRKDEGLARLELWAHPDDHGAIRAKAASLTKARQRKATSGDDSKG